MTHVAAVPVMHYCLMHHRVMHHGVMHRCIIITEDCGIDSANMLAALQSSKQAGTSGLSLVSAPVNVRQGCSRMDNVRCFDMNWSTAEVGEHASSLVMSP